MAYCPECGNEISITDKRCSKCGYKLMPSDLEDVKKGIKTKVHKSHHNIEFALAIITMVLWFLSLSQIINDYSFVGSGLLPLLLVILFIGILGAILTRYYAKPGAITVLIISLILIIFGINSVFLPILFSIITVVVAFVLN